MQRQHDAASAAPPRDRGHEFGARLDVDKLRAGSLRVGQEPLALLFRTLEAAAFP